MTIRTRNDLIKFIEDHAPSDSILRAVTHHNENLGFFTNLTVNRGGGWIVRVTSKFKRQWLIAVQLDERRKFGYYCWILSGEIPWKYHNNVKFKSQNTLYTGDYPTDYPEVENDNSTSRNN